MVPGPCGVLGRSRASSGRASPVHVLSVYLLVYLLRLGSPRVLPSPTITARALRVSSPPCLLFLLFLCFLFNRREYREEERRLQPGEVVLLDNSFPHQVYNDAEADRFVLMCEVGRPALTLTLTLALALALTLTPTLPLTLTLTLTLTLSRWAPPPSTCS